MGLLQARRLSRRPSPSATTMAAFRAWPDPVDLTRDDDDTDPERLILIPDENDEDGDDDDDSVRPLTSNEILDIEARFAKLSTSDIPHGYEQIELAESSLGAFITPGANVELEDGDFLRVKRVLRQISTGIDHMQGILLRRTRRVNRYFKRTQNELCAILQEANADNANTPVGQDNTLVLRPVELGVQLRDIVFTNAAFPAYSFRQNGRRYPEDHIQYIEDHEVLVCRYKFIEYVSLKDGRVVSGAIIAISEYEADDGMNVPDVLKKRNWIPAKKPPVSEAAISTRKRKSSTNVWESGALSSDPIDLTSSDESIIEDRFETRATVKRIKRSGMPTAGQSSISSYTSIRKASSSPIASPRASVAFPTPRQRKTYGDICAGAGGMARGAQAAGLSVSWLLDHWDLACNTLEKNWPGKSLNQSIFDFCTNKREVLWKRLVDVLHISFPCQTYAACYTVQGRNHDANSAAGYSVIQILERTRPRVVTFEQTSTLLTRHCDAFSALVHSLTTMKYSVRWKIFICSEYGNVQPRKRLFMIASCPGEPLPPFPKPTYGPGRRHPQVTIRDRLRLLPRNIKPYMQRFTAKAGRPYDARTPLRCCITCNGGDSDLHPNGDRSFDMQELALMAGFPPEHRFAKTGMTNLRKQIGNAVPSMVAKQIFDEVVESMEAADRVEEEYEPESIVID